jgi:hypothetical protein
MFQMVLLIELKIDFFKVEVEVVETVSDKEQDKWGPINSENVKDFFHFFLLL